MSEEGKKRGWIKWAVIGGILLLLVGGAYRMAKGTYNSMTEKDIAVDGTWGEVQNQYQRRSDLIPNLVSVVKGYADHEKETLEGVINARSKATSVNIDAGEMTPEKLEMFQKAQGELSGALSRLLVSVERYPDLKANQNFLELQAQLEGTENRIAVARKRFNESVVDYNTEIRVFPNNIFAGWYDFEKRIMFKADEGAEKAPEVKF